jgi:glycosyltransferase involved in cell wall biosynthesis
MKKKIILVDFGSEGASGFYINNVSHYLANNYNLIQFVHYKYKYEERVYKRFKIYGFLYDSFFKSFSTKFKIIDYFITFIFVTIYSLFFVEKNSIFNLQVYQSFRFYRIFLIIIKFRHKIILTIHDVLPHQSSYPRYIFTPIRNLTKLCLSVIVHNEYSKQKLFNETCVVTVLKFPLTNINTSLKRNLHFNQNNYTKKFLFIGNIRYEKGVDLLLEEWKKFQLKSNSNSVLTIAGKKCTNIDLPEIKNCNYLIKFLDDHEYYALIKSSDFVIFPYTGGTNSGVYANVISQLKLCICSNLPIFSESIYFDSDLAYCNHNDLSTLINLCDQMPFDLYQEKQKNMASILFDVESKLSIEYVNAYS